jgi:hypothetical protein
MRHDDDWPEQIEFDPRWEVQPEPGRDDDAGRSRHLAPVAAVAVALLLALLAWQAANAPPAL